MACTVPDFGTNLILLTNFDKTAFLISTLILIWSFCPCGFADFESTTALDCAASCHLGATRIDTLRAKLSNNRSGKGDHKCLQSLYTRIITAVSTLCNRTFCRGIPRACLRIQNFAGLIFLCFTLCNWTFCSGVTTTAVTLSNWTFCSGVCETCFQQLYTIANLALRFLSLSYRTFHSGVTTAVTLCNWTFCSWGQPGLLYNISTCRHFYTVQLDLLQWSQHNSDYTVQQDLLQWGQRDLPTTTSQTCRFDFLFSFHTVQLDSLQWGQHNRDYTEQLDLLQWGQRSLLTIFQICRFASPAFHTVQLDSLRWEQYSIDYTEQLDPSAVGSTGLASNFSALQV